MKNTLLRVIQTSNSNYNFFEIQLLEESLNGNLKGAISSYGSITFQQNRGETNWYGMTYVNTTSRFKDLEKFFSVAKRINKETDYNSQPEDVIKVLNGKKYFLFNHEFFAESDKGKRCYTVIRNGERYSRIVANDDKEATTKLAKHIKKISSTANWSVVEFFTIG